MQIFQVKNKFFNASLLIVLLFSSINATFMVDSPQDTIQRTESNSSTLLNVPTISGCEIFPEDNYWNVPIDELPVHSSSDAWVTAIGATSNFHMDFAAYLWNGGAIGIPYNIVSGSSVTNYNVSFQYSSESDIGPYPISANPLIEHGSDAHLLTIDTDDCTLYELYAASKSGSQWHAGSGAIWDLNSNDLRPDTWTSSDAAGLPILPGLARYEEVVAGVIAHALRFTSNCSANYYIWPARHRAQSGNCSNPPPFGARFRLKAEYDISGYSPEMQVILQAMKTYGIVLSDNGGSWVVSGEPHDGWDFNNNGYDEEINELNDLQGTDFEAVDTSSLMIDPDSAGTPYHRWPQVKQIIRANPSPINFSTVNFTVTFNQAVTGVNVSDFILITSGVSGSTISGISGSGSSYTVTVNTGSGDGSIRLDLVDDNSIQDSNSNQLGGMELGDGNFTGETYTIDKTPPTLLSITRGGTTPSPALAVNFLVTFSEPVIEVDNADFVLTTTLLSSAEIINVSGSGSTRVVTVNTGFGDGTIGLNYIDNDTITDIATNLITTSNLVGQVYTIDKPNIPAPILKSPGLNITTNDTTPAFWWRNVTGGQTYQIQFASDNAFNSIVHNNNNAVSPYTPPAFTEGTYYWHVRAYNVTNQPGAWSLTRIFTIDTTGPAAPTLTSPTTSSRTPTLRWSTPSGAVAYQIQVDTDLGFSVPIYFNAELRATSRRMSVMPSGTYYWHVRAKDALGNWGAWSTTATITIP